MSPNDCVFACRMTCMLISLRASRSWPFLQYEVTAEAAAHRPGSGGLAHILFEFPSDLIEPSSTRRSQAEWRKENVNKKCELWRN